MARRLCGELWGIFLLWLFQPRPTVRLSTALMSGAWLCILLVDLRRRANRRALGGRERTRREKRQKGRQDPSAQDFRAPALEAPLAILHVRRPLRGDVSRAQSLIQKPSSIRMLLTLVRRGRLCDPPLCVHQEQAALLLSRKYELLLNNLWQRDDEYNEGPRDHVRSP